MIKKISISIMILLTLVSCKVSLVPDYSESLEKEIIATQKQNDKLYIDMLQTDESMRVFKFYEKEYSSIESEISSIEFQNNSREKSQDINIIIKNLKASFDNKMMYHKTKKTLSDGEIKVYQAEMNGFWLPLLTAEKALKSIKK